MSYTTNDATKRLPMTYHQRAVECERLLKVAQAMDSLAFGTENFLDHPRFTQLEKEFQARFQALLSLTTI